jgi:hypothetical protein
MKNVSIWFQQKPIPQLSMFCLIQGIHNYVQINTYWSYIVQICIFIDLANNIPRTLTSHYIINVVTGIINESHWLRLLDIVEFALSTFRTWNFITFLLDTTLILHQQASFMISSFNRFIFSEIFCMQVSDFC